MITSQEVVDDDLVVVKEVYSTLDINEDVMKTELGAHFKFFLVAGVINLGLGIWALCLPVTSSRVIVDMLAVLLILVGLSNCAEVFGCKYYRGPALVGGFACVILGFLLVINAIPSLPIVTILVAFVYLCGGILRIHMGRKHPNMVGSRTVLVTGIVGTLVSVAAIIVILCIDFGNSFSNVKYAAEKNFAALLGVNWVAYGVERLFLGFKGRAIAKETDVVIEGVVGGDYVNVA